jgi:antitoxin (DNA-binding transcriptional repressor) of toxin-antitoxin stability system
MGIYGVTEAKARLSQLLRKALRGEAVVIAKNGKPLVRMERLPQRPAGDRAAAEQRIRRYRGRLSWQGNLPSMRLDRTLIKRTVKKYRNTLRKLRNP